MDKIYMSNYSNTCRLCLTNHKLNIQIFGNIGDELQIDVKIHTCLPVKISKNDGFPSNICYKCLYHLETFYNFRNTCIESEKHFINNSDVKEEISKNDLDLIDASSTSSSGLDFQFMLGTAADSDDSKDDEPTIKLVPCMKSNTSQPSKNLSRQSELKCQVMQHGDRYEGQDHISAVNKISEIRSPEIKPEEKEVCHSNGEQHQNLNNIQDENSCDFIVPRRRFQMDFNFNDDEEGCALDVEMVNSCRLHSDNVDMCSNTGNQQVQNITQINKVSEQSQSLLHNDDMLPEVAAPNSLPSADNNMTSSVLPGQHIENSIPDTGIKKAQHWLSQLFKDKEQTMSNSSSSQHTLFSFRSRSSSEDIFKEGSGHSNLTPVFRQNLDENREVWCGQKCDSTNIASGENYSGAKIDINLNPGDNHRPLSSLEYYSDPQIFHKRGNLATSYKDLQSNLRERRRHGVNKTNRQADSKNIPDFKTWYKNTQTAFPHWKSNISNTTVTEPSISFHTGSQL